jgi:hypothetical protein
MDDSKIQKLLPVQLIGLTDLQKQYLNDYSHRFFVLPPGRRSRKTLLSSRKLLINALKNSDHRYFQGAPTRQQAKAIFWDRLKKNTRPFWKSWPSETDLSVTLLNDTEIHVVGLDKPQRIEGQPWHGCHITEFDDTKTGAWEANIRPVLSDTNGWAIIDGVPEGRDKIYNLALYACNGSIPVTKPIIGAYAECREDPEWCYYHWFSSDVLAPKEIEAAKRSMDIKTFRQEYEGSFEGFDGLAYYALTDSNIVDPCDADPRLPIIIGMDFNYDPMCSVAIQEVPYKGQIIPRVIESFAFRNCTTEAACERIISRFGVDFRYEIFPDASAKNGSAHGVGISDLAIIRKSFSCTKGFNVFNKPANPKRKDRLNAVNARLSNAAGEIGMLIGRNCKELINDFQRVTMEEFLNDSFHDKSLGHISDAIGYYIDFRYPVVTGASKYSTRLSI